MATRLLSFLRDIEQALLAAAPASPSPTWEIQRVVNYRQGLARMSLLPVASAPGGAIFLQSFLLADGSICLKANLAWDGATAGAQVAVYSKPDVNWAAEAKQIATIWLSGPAAASAVVATPTEPLSAVAS